MTRYVILASVLIVLIIATATGARTRSEGAATPGTPGAPTLHVATFLPTATPTSTPNVSIPTFQVTVVLPVSTYVPSWVATATPGGIIRPTCAPNTVTAACELTPAGALRQHWTATAEARP